MTDAYRNWTTAPERGSVGLIALIAKLARWFPRRWVSVLLIPIVGYFVTFSPRQVTASRQFLARALNRTPRHSEVYAHYMTFARMLLDRVYWLSRDDPAIPTRVYGVERVQHLLAERRGFIILGSHLGSFEALRGLGRLHVERRVRPVMYVANAPKVQTLLDSINPELARDVILAGRPSTMLEIRQAIDAGDLVGILADRTPFSERTVSVPFMGQPAPLPIGAYRLAEVLEVPLVFACAVLDGSGYSIFFEPLDCAIGGASGAERETRIAAHATRFAQCLERYARAYPLNWFNFYDFWHGRGTQPDAANAERGTASGVA